MGRKRDVAKLLAYGNQVFGNPLELMIPFILTDLKIGERRDQVFGRVDRVLEARSGVGGREWGGRQIRLSDDNAFPDRNFKE